MSSIGSFGTFTTARLGIYAAQKGLSVVGNNIANINTPGYTRQRLDQVSFKTGGADRYASQNDKKVGNGVLCSNVSQLRDPYLDIRYRTEMASYGAMNTTMKGLDDLASILDEIGRGMGADDEDGIIHAQISDFLKSLEQLSTDSAAQTNDTLAQASADQLCQLFNKYADRLETLEKDYIDEYTKKVTQVNNILTSIRDLNVSIRKSDIHGDPALELRDERNLLIDELSEYMKIDVLYSEEDLGAGLKVEKLTIRLANANPDKTVTSDSATLVDGIYAAQLAMPRENPEYAAAAEILDKNSDAYKKAIQNLPAEVNIGGTMCKTQEEIDNAIDQYLTAHPEMAIKSFKYLDENDAGTNDILDAQQVPNENYDLTVTKLLDKYGKEWTDPKAVTEKLDQAPAGAPVRAVYETEVGTQGTWTSGDTIKVGDKTLRVMNSGGDITPEDAAKPEELAKVLAKAMAGQVPGYTVKANGKNLVFTARNAGAVGTGDDDTGPDSAPVAPAITVSTDKDGVVSGIPTTAITNATTPGTNATQGFLDAQKETTLDDGLTTKKVTYFEVEGQWYQTTTVTKHTEEVPLDDNDLYGSLQSYRELLTESGQFASNETIDNIDENAAIKRGIPYYRYSLDLLARKFATEFNKLNTGFAINEKGEYLTNVGTEKEPEYKLLDPVTFFVDADGKYAGTTAGTGLTEVTLTLSNSLSKEDQENLQKYLADEGYEDINAYLKDNDGAAMGGALFSNRGDGNDTTDITASNISISKQWSTGEIHIVPTYVQLFEGDGEHTTKQDNIGHMITLIDKRLDYNPQDLVGNAASSHLVNGSFQEMLDNMCSVLGNDQRTTNVKLSDHATTATELDMSRDGVSGVDLNDEAMNLMQYSKALNAAYRLMTTLDEALERLINNTGVVGR